MNIHEFLEYAGFCFILASALELACIWRFNVEKRGKSALIPNIFQLVLFVLCFIVLPAFIIYGALFAFFNKEAVKRHKQVEREIRAEEEERRALIMEEKQRNSNITFPSGTSLQYRDGYMYGHKEGILIGKAIGTARVLNNMNSDDATLWINNNRDYFNEIKEYDKYYLLANFNID
ncbi:MAG: hypothetical protein E7432_04340 [Ruminococcaceae bacterium]|nr:hypothetical protein [Oscillospiraceae bacterium]